MLKAILPDIISTLLINGFNLNKIDRFPHNNSIIYTYKYDKLGATVKYIILFTEDDQETSIVNTLISLAEHYVSTPLIISDKITTTKCRVYSNDLFFSFFGGIVNTGLILISNIANILDQLGHKKLVNGLIGKAEDLHEIYVKECLQFIMESPTRRYGIDRSFESLPDAVVLSKDRFMLLVDSKAYTNGFSFKSDDLKRFKSYVEEFNTRYSSFFGPIFSFLVVSGSFNDSEAAIRARSDEFYRMCGCKLCCITSKELGSIVLLLKDNPDYKRSINWKNIFSEVLIKDKAILKEFKKLIKDNLH